MNGRSVFYGIIGNELIQQPGSGSNLGESLLALVIVPDIPVETSNLLSLGILAIPAGTPGVSN